RYKDILREYFQNEIHRTDYENFLSHIETTQEASDIQAWLKQMSRTKVYTPKELPDGITEPIRLETLGHVKQHCLQYLKDRILRSASSLRITGKAFLQLPPGQLRRSLEWILRKQRRFPMETAHSIGGRLHRAHFSIYRKKNQGRLLTFICAIKRKFRTGKEVFEPEVQAVIEWLESHSVSTQELATMEENIPHAKQHLSWLIQAGFVTELEDGRLLLHDIIPEPRKKSTEENSSEGKDDELAVNEETSQEITASADETPLPVNVKKDEEPPIAESYELSTIPPMESTSLTESKALPTSLAISTESETTLTVYSDTANFEDAIKNPSSY
ncbi:MAG: hypothetical protein LBG98_01060, partial [Puniceicoccales bacterium]|nr:hypothetical protein [Puniceicoccales bacterium]